MPPLWLQIVTAIVGLGVVKYMFDRWTKLSEPKKWGISIITLIILITAQYYYYAPPSPRYLTQEQEDILVIEFSKIRDIKLIYVAALPNDRESNDFASNLTRPLHRAGIKILLGRPFERRSFIYGDFNVPPLSQEFWLYFPGLTVFVTQGDEVPPSQSRPLNAVQIGKAFEQVCLKVSLATDFRLGSNEYTLFVGANQSEKFEDLKCHVLRRLVALRRMALRRLLIP